MDEGYVRDELHAPQPLAIGPYRVRRLIGEGGSGRVYEAEDPAGRRVAVKLVRASGARAIAQLQREARIAARLDHPNVVRILGNGVHEDQPFIAMELLEGPTLAAALPSLPARRRLELLRDVALGAAAAHARRITHRDIKPQNVIVAGDRAVLTDFGIAREEGLTRTTAGVVQGTPSYMAPEQYFARAESIGPPTDVWALGVMLREIGAPPELEAVRLKAMEVKPGWRYADAGEFAAEIQRHLDGQPVRTRTRAVARWVRRHPVAPAAAVAAIATAVAAVFLTVARREREAAAGAMRELASAHVRSALELRRAGAYDRIRQFLPALEEARRKALALSPGAAEPDYLLGRMHRVLLDEKAALECQNAALAKDPSFAPALYERVVVTWRLHRDQYVRAAERVRVRTRRDASEEAIAAADPSLAPMVEAMRRDVAGLKGLSPAMMLAARGMVPPGDRSMLERAVGLDPSLEEAHEALATFGTYEERERAYSAGLENDRGFLRYWQARGQARLRQERFDEAEADFEERLRLRPEPAEVWLLRGMARHFRGVMRAERGESPLADLEKAEGDFEKALAMDGSLVWSYVMRGRCRLERGIWRWRQETDPMDEFAGAEADFGECTRMAAWIPDGWEGRGRVRIQRAMARAGRGMDAEADYAAAIEDFGEALRRLRDPGILRQCAAARLSRAQWRGRADKEDVGRAIEELDECLAVTRDAEARLGRAQALTLRAEALCREGSNPDADLARAEADVRESKDGVKEAWLWWLVAGQLRFARARRMRDVGADARGEYLGAAEALEEAVRRKPSVEGQVAVMIEAARREGR